MKAAATTGARWLILSLPLLLALVFVPVLAAPFTVPKTAILTFSAFALAIVLLALAPKCKPCPDERSFWIATIAYFAIVLLSAIASPLRYMSLASIVFVASGVLLFAAARILLTANTRAILVTATSGALIVALITLAQFCAFKLPGAFSTIAPLSGRMRMYATLGNPNFVAAFLAGAIPAPIALTLIGHRLRLLWIASVSLIALALVLTGSRGGVLALVAVAIVFCFTALQTRRVLALVVGAVVLTCILSVSMHLNPRTAMASARGRVFIWRVALGDGAARSVTGSGPGTFAYLYPARLGRFFSDPGRETLLYFGGHERHAQNDLVESWHDTGSLGLASMLTMFGLWCRVATRRLREARGQVRSVVAAAIAGVVAICVASMFDFSMHRAETWSLLWLWMAIPLMEAALCVPPRPRFAALRLGGAVLATIAGVYCAFAPVASSYWVARGHTQETRGNVALAREAYHKALRWDASSPDAHFDLARAMAKAGDLPGGLSQSRLASRFVNEPELFILRSRILQNMGNSKEALRELEMGARLFPYSRELGAELGSYSAAEVTAIGR